MPSVESRQATLRDRGVWMEKGTGWVWEDTCISGVLVDVCLIGKVGICD